VDRGGVEPAADPLRRSGLVTILLPSILAAEARGQNRFELDAETVDDALRALPVANMLFDERGELRRLVNVYVDGTDVRGSDGVATKLSGGEEIRVVQAVAGGNG
jgi:molybdopterin synthase sulfur carrier subunit